MTHETTSPMPVVFIGHGNPMNAITDNPYAAAWHELAQQLPRPRAILCISAHWYTRGTRVGAMERPTHDSRLRWLPPDPLRGAVPGARRPRARRPRRPAPRSNARRHGPVMGPRPRRLVRPAAHVS